MFYLIGGAPRAGKTTIAKQLSKELGVPWISTDTLESVVAEYVPDEKIPKLFPKSVARRETSQSNDIFYSKYTAEEIKNLYFQQAAALRDALSMFVASEAHCEHEYIIEGYHIPPELVLQLSAQYPIRSVFVGRENVEATKKAIMEGTQQNDWVVTKTKNEETFGKIAKMLVSFSHDVRTEAEKRNLTYIDTGVDFPKSIERAVQRLQASD